MSREELHTIILEAQGATETAQARSVQDYHRRGPGIDLLPDPNEKGRYFLTFASRRRGLGHLVLTDYSGNTLLQKERQCQTGHNRLQLNLTDVQPGRYTLTILMDADVQRVQVVLL